MSTLDIEPLRSFHAVATFGGVRSAATALHLSPATVSGHLRRLERELGCAVVTHEGRGVALTADGEELAVAAREILDLHDDTIRSLRTPGPRDLVIAATEHAAACLVPSIVAVVGALLPDHTVRLRLTKSARARALLDEDRADIALMLSRGSPGSLLAATVRATWFGIDTAPRDRLVLFTAPCALRDSALASLTGRSYTVARDCADRTTVLAAARAGAGITPIPPDRASAGRPATG